MNLQQRGKGAPFQKVENSTGSGAFWQAVSRHSAASRTQSSRFLIKFPGTWRRCELTGGALDITAYPAVKAWGFTQEEHCVPSPGELAELAGKIDYTAVGLEGESAPPSG